MKNFEKSFLKKKKRNLDMLHIFIDEVKMVCEVMLVLLIILEILTNIGVIEY